MAYTTYSSEEAAPHHPDDSSNKGWHVLGKQGKSISSHNKYLYAEGKAAHEGTNRVVHASDLKEHQRPEWKEK